MTRFAPAEELFEGRHFDQEIVVPCVRWYLRFKLSYRDLVAMMDERGVEPEAGCGRSQAVPAQSYEASTSAHSKITLDAYAASHRAVTELKDDGESSKYLNNLIEQDHRQVKQRIGAMVGLKISGRRR